MPTIGRISIDKNIGKTQSWIVCTTPTESKGCVPPPQSLLAARVPGIREVRSRRHKELLAPRVALDQCEEKAHAFFVPLMDLCRVDTPLVKRVPNSQCSRFATMWGKLLSQAVADKSLGSWSEFFMFPKCILWTPVRGGKRIAKKANFTDLVRTRLNKWSAAGREGLWKDVLYRNGIEFIARLTGRQGSVKPKQNERTLGWRR